MKRWMLPMLIVLLASPVLAQGGTKMARGTVTAVSADALTVMVRGRTMTFAIDDKTEAVPAEGERRTAATQKSGAKPKISDLIKVDQSVAVSYHEMPGMMHAAKIQVVTSKPK